MSEKEAKQDEQIKTIFVEIDRLLQRLNKIEKRLEDIVVLKDRVDSMQKYEDHIHNLDKNMALIAESVRYMQKRDEQQDEEMKEFKANWTNSLNLFNSVMQKQVELDSRLNLKVDSVESSIQNLSNAIDKRVSILEVGDSKFIHDTRDSMQQDMSNWIGLVQKYSPIVTSVGMIILIIMKALGKL